MQQETSSNFVAIKNVNHLLCEWENRILLVFLSPCYLLQKYVTLTTKLFFVVS